MLAKTSIAILTTGPWGKRIARNIYKDQRFFLLSLIANIADEKDEIWEHAEIPGQITLDDDNEKDKEMIDKILVAHGLVPSMEEIDGDKDSPDKYKRTVDLAVVDLGKFELNGEAIRRLKKHVSIRIVVLAATPKEKVDLEEMGVYVVCPVIDGYGAADQMVEILGELAKKHKRAG